MYSHITFIQLRRSDAWRQASGLLFIYGQEHWRSRQTPGVCLLHSIMLYWLRGKLRGTEHDAIHTDDLPLKAGTPDSAINDISKSLERIVITKDTDFLDSYYINNSPSRLLLIITGNIVNKELYRLFTKNIAAIIAAFNDHSLVELDNNDLIIHE